MHLGIFNVNHTELFCFLLPQIFRWFLLLDKPNHFQIPIPHPNLRQILSASVACRPLLRPKLIALGDNICASIFILAYP